jgi:hypothetical protein
MTGIKEIIQSPIFAKQKKKLHKGQIKDLDMAVKAIAQDPTTGYLKAGDLQDIRVYKFKSMNRQFLLAYETAGPVLFLHTFGSHENFYRNLKRYAQQ